MKLRPYQQDLKDGIYNAWSSGASNVLAVAPTGAGKTVLFGSVIHDHNGASCAIAHRTELVSQISMALAREEVKHRIIAPKTTIRDIVKMQIDEFGKQYYRPNEWCAVASVGTLLARGSEVEDLRRQCSLWVQDECHHVLRENQWGRAASMFPHAKGLGVTATPVRADGNGLGRHADGLFDTMVEGPTMRDLIAAGFLTDYRIFAPPSDLDLDGLKVGKTGDFSNPQLKQRVQKSHIVGDVVEHYLRIARGKLGVTFATDVETATEIAAKFNAAGVPAEIVSAKTPPRQRAAAIKRFRSRQILQLVNVDLFGEGFDLPAIEVVSMARPTASYGLYVQQFGRALRVLDGKSHAIIIDHVGNVKRHGLPDAARTWSLDGRERGGRGALDPDLIPVKACPMCTSVYEAVHSACPFCGHVIEPSSRSSPEYVDGDLTELDPATLAEMRGEIARIDMPPEDYRLELAAKYAPIIGQLAGVKRHTERQQAQGTLRESIALWAGWQRALNRSDAESYRRFYFAFGVDVATAQTLGRKDAEDLAVRVNAKLVDGGVNRAYG